MKSLLMAEQNRLGKEERELGSAHAGGSTA